MLLGRWRIKSHWASRRNAKLEQMLVDEHHKSGIPLYACPAEEYSPSRGDVVWTMVNSCVKNLYPISDFIVNWCLLESKLCNASRFTTIVAHLFVCLVHPPTFAPRFRFQMTVDVSYRCLCVSVDTRECESQCITHGILVCAALL